VKQDLGRVRCEADLAERYELDHTGWKGLTERAQLRGIEQAPERVRELCPLCGLKYVVERLKLAFARTLEPSPAHSTQLRSRDAGPAVCAGETGPFFHAGGPGVRADDGLIPVNFKVGMLDRRYVLARLRL
jgi:hypothetical protein